MASYLSTDPGREIAQMALAAPSHRPTNVLEEALRYAFDQLGFHRTDAQLLALLDDLRATITEDA